jgi:outer membrane protein, multidrug efflux system
MISVRLNRRPGFFVLAAILSGCGIKGGWITTVGPNYRQPDAATAKQWYASQPENTAHQGELSKLQHWWERFNDPVLIRLLAAAQTESASIATAKSRIEQARANLVGSDSQFLPNIDSSLNSSRSSFSFGQAPFLRNQHMLNVQSSWEIDLFGGLARQQEAARGQLESRTAAWHDARVAVAAELANAYLAYRSCEIQRQLIQADAGSRLVSAQLVEIAARAGLRTFADVALAHASSADGNNLLLQQQAQCDRSIKGLVAMTAIEEKNLRALLVQTPEKAAQLPSPPIFKINAIPATLLLQRPDVAVAERDMAEACAKIGVEQANRYPKLNLSGNIAPVLQNINGSAFAWANTWSIGPTLSLPLFDAGKRTANVEAAKAEYSATVMRFRATVRIAAKEVEEALVRLANAGQRLPEVQLAANDYQTSYQSAQTLYETGLGNLLDVETARRTAVNAELAVRAVEHEKISALIALYRAVGGGWEERQGK